MIVSQGYDFRLTADGGWILMRGPVENQQREISMPLAVFREIVYAVFSVRGEPMPPGLPQGDRALIAKALRAVGAVAVEVLTASAENDADFVDKVREMDEAIDTLEDAR